MRRLLDLSERIANIILFVAFAITFIVVMLQVISRFLTFISVPWVEEITGLCFVYIFCFGAPLAIKYKEFVKVDLLSYYIPKRVELLLDSIIHLLITVFCFVVGISSFTFIKVSLRITTSFLHISMAYAVASVLISFFLQSAVAAFKTVESARQLFNKNLVVQYGTNDSCQLEKRNTTGKNNNSISDKSHGGKQT